MHMYKFFLDMSYAEGLIIIAAKDKKQALAILDECCTEYRTSWEYDGVIRKASYNGKAEVIVNVSYIE